jgi:hypothetical protein
MTTGESQGNIVKLSDIRRERHRASSPYGPLRAGLITWQNREMIREDQEVQLTELLNSLESAVADLNSKSYTVCATLTTAIQGVRVALFDTTTDEAGTDEAP